MDLFDERQFMEKAHKRLHADRLSARSSHSSMSTKRREELSYKQTCSTSNCTTTTSSSLNQAREDTIVSGQKGLVKRCSTNYTNDTRDNSGSIHV